MIEHPPPGGARQSAPPPVEKAGRVGQDDAIPDGFVVPFYLNDRKLRISVARVGDHLYAFGDLCACADHAAAAWGGE